jgi:hypothetical protein
MHGFDFEYGQWQVHHRMKNAASGGSWTGIRWNVHDAAIHGRTTLVYDSPTYETTFTGY